MREQWRSLLFVPADDREKIAKAARGGADAVILDLEDGVPPQMKDRARAGLCAAAAEVVAHGKGLVVRVDAGVALEADVATAVAAGVGTLMLPKVAGVPDLRRLADMLAPLERTRAGDAPVSVIALVESPAALLDLPALSRHPLLTGLALGSEDFALGLGRPPSPENLDLPSRLVALAAAASDLMALAVPVSIATYRDLEAWRDAAQRAYACGCTGALCIHPRQADVCNSVFMPSQATIADALSVCSAWEDATARGQAVTTHDGRMIDAPVARRARRLLARLDRVPPRSAGDDGRDDDDREDGGRRASARREAAR